MKKKAYQHWSERKFEGDWIFFRLQTYKQSTLKQKKNKKLAPKFYGLYNIICNIREVAYKLYFPSSNIHKGFHVSFLKKVIGQKHLLHIKLLELDEQWRFILELDKSYRPTFSSSL